MDYFEAMALLKKGSPASVYLCYGEEPFLFRRFLAELKQNLMTPETEAYNYEEIDGESVSVEEILESLCTLPLLGGKKLVVVTGSRIFSSRKKRGKDANKEDKAQAGPHKDKAQTDPLQGEIKVLSDYLGKPLLSACLVFAAGDKVDRSLRAYRLLAGYGAVVEFSPLKGPSLVEWIQKRFADAGKKADRAVVAHLTGMIGNDLYRLASEIDKISNYAGDDKQIGMNMAREVISRTIQDNIFSLTDALGTGSVESAVRILKDLLAQGDQPIRISAAISRQFRLIRAASDYLSFGWSQQEAIEKLGIHPFAARKCLEQARRFSGAQLDEALKYCLQSDADIKTGRMEPVPALEMLVARLCSLKTGMPAIARP